VLDFILNVLSEHKEIAIALITVIGVVFTAYIALRNNNKNILIKTVTDERAQWRKDLRNSCAEFSKLVYEQATDKSKTNKARIVELKAHIKLRTNPSEGEKHKLDKDILKESQEIVALLDEDPAADKDLIIEKVISLESNVQKLLKQEWDKSKGEAVSGKLAK
jgi:hypothetical protein